MIDYDELYSSLGPDPDPYIYCPESSDEEKSNFPSPHPTAIPPQPSRLGDVFLYVGIVVGLIGLIALSVYFDIHL